MDRESEILCLNPKKIRIPEYDPKGFFEVDKVNGVLR